MTAEIIAVGTELLLGEIVNTNARFLAQELATVGIAVHFQSVVGDNPQRLAEALKEALSRSRIVITTGGLGPTADDITKEVICKAVGKELVLFEDELEKMKEKFRHISCTMTRNNTKQVMFPADAIILPNPNGTAPGCAIKGGSQMIIMLPGPPYEMEPMFKASVRPLLEEMSQAVFRSVRLEFFGIGESALEEKLRHLMESENPTVAPYAKVGQVAVRVTSSAATAAACDALNREMIRKIEELVGSFIYGYDDASMEQVMLEKMAEQGLTLASAEIFTGGELSDRITDCPLSQKVYLGGNIPFHPEELRTAMGIERRVIRKNGVVSPAIAARLAIQTARLHGSHVGLSACSGENEEGNTVSYVGVYGFGKVYVKEVDVTHHKINVHRMKQITATHGFDMVRRLVDDELRDTLEVLSVFPEELDLKGKGNLKLMGRDRNPPAGGKKIGLLIVILGVAVTMILAGYLARDYWQQLHGTTTETQAPSSVPQSSGEAQVESYLQKFGEAYNKNKDVVGYLTCAGIQSPVVKSTDNTYYFTHGLDGGEGSLPFMESDVGQTKNAVLYAKGGDGEIFHFLRSYEDPKYCKENPVITLGDTGEESKYKIVAVFYGCTNDENGVNFPYWDYSGSDDDAVNTAYVEELKMRSLVDMGVDVKGDDVFVTLHTNVTTYYGGRFAVVARKVRAGESDTVDTAAIKAKDNPLMPPSWSLVMNKKTATEKGPYTSLIK